MQRDKKVGEICASASDSKAAPISTEMSLLTLGAIGERFDLSANDKYVCSGLSNERVCTLMHFNAVLDAYDRLQAALLEAFSSPHESVRNTASLALGRVTVGNLAV